MESILTDDDEHCYICELSGYDTISRHEHHIFFGPLRDTSERMGFKVPLCAYHHNMSKNSVHFDRKLDVMLKRMCQAKFEETHSREEFMALIGRNYLD